VGKTIVSQWNDTPHMYLPNESPNSGGVILSDPGITPGQSEWGVKVVFQMFCELLYFRY